MDQGLSCRQEGIQVNQSELLVENFKLKEQLERAELDKDKWRGAALTHAEDRDKEKARAKKAEENLSLTNQMLAKQCDRAMELETERNKLRRRLVSLSGGCVDPQECTNYEACAGHRMAKYGATANEIQIWRTE
jgi:hypothetical protein